MVGEAIEEGRPSWRWRLRLEGRVWLVAVYWRTERTVLDSGSPYGILPTAVSRAINSLGLLALFPVRNVASIRS